MSLGARWTLGSFALLFAVTCLYSGLLAEQHRFASIAFAGFCTLIAAACFSSRARPASVRIVGFVIFCAYLAYFISEILFHRTTPPEGAGHANWFNAIIGLFVFGLPGLYVSLTGRYSAWGEHSTVFARKNQQAPKDDSPAPLG